MFPVLKWLVFKCFWYSNGWYSDLHFTFYFFVQVDPSKSKRKFSSFFKSLVIELDKDLYGPDNHLVTTTSFVYLFLSLLTTEGIWNVTIWNSETFEIWTFSRLDFKWSKTLVCIWSGFQLGFEIQKPNHLKSGQMAAILWKNIWNPDINAILS